MAKIIVDITGHDVTEPWFPCPLRNSEYGVCVAHEFLHPPTKPNQRGMKCLQDVDIEEGPMAGLCIYVIPDACPLRKGPVVVEGK